MLSAGLFSRYNNELANTGAPYPVVEMTENRSGEPGWPW